MKSTPFRALDHLDSEEALRAYVEEHIKEEREACAKIVEEAADNLFEDGKLSLAAVKLLLRGDVAAKIRNR